MNLQEGDTLDWHLYVPEEMNKRNIIVVRAPMTAPTSKLVMPELPIGLLDLLVGPHIVLLLLFIM